MGDETLNRDALLRELRRIKPDLATRFGVLRLALFGSFARDEARPESDVDIVVELAKPDLFALVHIREALENDLNRPVDLIPYSRTMNEFLKDRIRNEAEYV